MIYVKQTVLYTVSITQTVQEYGPPEAFVTDSGSIFLAKRAQAIYRALGIRKLEIEKGQPWQSYIETAWGVQRRMADHYFSKAENWTGLLEEHDRWIHDYNVQEHYAHQERKPGRRSPSEVLSWVKTPRYQEDLARAFFSARHTRTLDNLGYLTLQRFRLYAEEGLARGRAGRHISERCKDHCESGGAGPYLQRQYQVCHPPGPATIP